MRALTKAPNWILFIVLLAPYVAGDIYYLLYAVGVFLSVYWIMSAGKYGTMILDTEGTGYHIAFNICSRLVFISLAAFCILGNDRSLNLFGIGNDNLIRIAGILFCFTLGYVAIYAAYVLNKLSGVDENGIINQVFTAVLFLIFPLGVWILQSKINKYIGDELE